MTRVGFVGVGSIGLPMLERVASSGFEVSFFARRPEAVTRAEKSGAHAVGSLRDLGSSSDVVVVCVYTDAQVDEVCAGPDGLFSGLAAGALVIIHTTCSPNTITALAELGRRAGVDVLDAAFSGSPDAVATGTITVLVGGPTELLERARPVLSAYAETILPVGELGDGQKVKLVNNALLGANAALVVEADRVARDLGLEPGTAFDAIAHCSGNSFALGVARVLGSAQKLVELAGPYIDKDVATAQRVAADCGVDLGALAPVAATGATRAEVPTAQMLWDIEQIKQLKARYFRLIDTKQWDAFRDLFTEDCRHLLPSEAGPQRYQLGEVYLESISTVLADAMTVHHGHMPEIRLLSETEAEGTWSMFDYVDIPGGITNQGYGHYHETYRKGPDGQWRISSKDNRRLRIDPLEDGPPAKHKHHKKRKKKKKQK
jgi:3-hydroxyisobutyrate dehydrogenase-like beta-hydroxyacid dehydrogenase